MSVSGQAEREQFSATLQRARLTAAALAGGVLLLTAVSGFIPLDRASWASRLVLPSGLAGLFALIGGWRLYLLMRDNGGPSPDVASACARYQTALLVALGLTEGVAFLGIVIFLLSGRIESLVGVLTHVMLTGVLWPAEDKLQPFLDRLDRG